MGLDAGRLRQAGRARPLDATVWIDADQLVGRAAEAPQHDEHREGEHGERTADHVPTAERPGVGDRPQPDLAADPADRCDHRIEGDDGRPVLRHRLVMEVRLAHRRDHSHGAGHDQQTRNRDPEARRHTDQDGGHRTHRRCPEQHRRALATSLAQPLDDLIADDRRERDTRGDQTDHPHRIAVSSPTLPPLYCVQRLRLQRFRRKERRQA